MPGNPYLVADLAGKRFSVSSWRNVASRLSEQLFDVALLRNFFQVWKAQDYTAALDSLPDDLPETTANEAISEEEIQKRAEDFFGKPFSEIKNGDLQQLEQNVGKTMAKIRDLLARKRDVDGIVYDLETEIKNIQFIQQSEKTLA